MSSAADAGAATRVGVIGRGAIGAVVVDTLLDGGIDGAELSGVLVRTTDPADPHVVTSLDQLLASSDIVVEAAGQDALASYGAQVLRSGRDLVAVSIGALSRGDVMSSLEHAGPGRLHIAAGALGGVDMLRSVGTMGAVHRARIVTTKLPRALVQEWMSEDEASEVLRADSPMQLFEGPVRTLVGRFPSSTNVAATLALAVGSWDIVTGEVWADPSAELTSHRVDVVAEAGEYSFEMRHRPSRQNPRSSAVVPWAVVRVLRDLCGGSWRFA